MKFKISSIYFLLMFPLAGIFAQIPIQGKIKGNMGEIPTTVTVKIMNQQTENTASVNADGSFETVVDRAGVYTLQISAPGYATHREDIYLSQTDGHEIPLITLFEKVQELQAVEVIGRKKKNYLSDYSFSATKVAIPNEQLPQALTAVTKELIQDRQAFQLADAVRAVGGVSPSSVYNQYNIRGVSQNEEGQIINGMRTRQFYFLQPLTAHVERVEVLKGPASVSFSSVDPGGSINLVTKKPLNESRKSISLGVGSFSTLRGALDITGPLTKDQRLLFRVNTAFQEAKSYRDLIQNNAFLFVPSISYLPDDKTALNVEMIYSNGLGNLDRGQPIFGAVAGQTDLNSTPIGTNLGATNDYFQSEEWILTASLSRQLTEHFGIHMAYMKQTWREDLREHRTLNRYAVDIGGNPIPTLAAMRFVERQQFWDIDNLNAYFDLKFKTGNISHQFVGGFDVHRWHQVAGGGQNSARGYRLKNGTISRSFDPANAAAYETLTYKGQTIPRPNVDHFNLETPSNVIKIKENYIFDSQFAIPANLSETQAVYLQNLITLGPLTALLSLRSERFVNQTNYNRSTERSFKNTALIPRVGLSYKLQQFNFYATYLEGFQPQSNTVTLMPNTGNFFWNPNSAAQFDPLRSTLKEFGIKAGLLDGRFQTILSVYEIQQKNILISANSAENPDLLTQRGGDRSRGIEWELNGFLSPQLQVNASYSYIDAIITGDDNPDLVGQRKENTPKHSANYWMRYDFLKNTGLQDFGVGFGIQHSGAKVPWFTRDFEVPGYTLLDAAVYFRPQASHMQITCKVNNLLNKTHWLGAQTYFRLFPGAPRNIALTATYTF